MHFKLMLSLFLLAVSINGHAIDDDYLKLEVIPGTDNKSLTVSFNANDSEIVWHRAGDDNALGTISLQKANSRLTIDNRMRHTISGLECGSEYDIQVRWHANEYLYRGQHVMTDRCELELEAIEKNIEG